MRFWKFQWHHDHTTGARSAALRDMFVMYTSENLSSLDTVNPEEEIETIMKFLSPDCAIGTRLH